MKTVVAFVANRVIADRNDHRVSVIDWLDDLTVQGLPIVFPRIAAVWLLQREVEDAETGVGKITILVGGEVISTIDVEIALAGQRRTRAVTNIAGLAISAPCEVEFRFAPPNHATHDASYSFLISAVPQQVGAQSTTTGTTVVV